MTAAAAMICLALPTAASAHAVRPPAPSAIRVLRVSSSSITVSASSRGAHHYRVFAALKPKQLAVATIMRTAKKSALSSSSTVTVRNLGYSTAPYYYRVEAINGNRGRFSAVAGSVGLLPPTPTGVRAVQKDTGSYLSWQSGPATGYEVSQSTDPDMKQNLATYLTTGLDKSFTPTGLTPGTTYYFTVRAMNGSTHSAASTPVSVGTSTLEQPVSVMSYNVLEATGDGRHEGGQVVAPWTQRLPKVVGLIHQANPDVIAIEEAASYVDGSTTERQIDSLTDALGGEYTLASTEIPPGQPHFFRTGVYILYKSSDFTAVGAGNHWDLGQSRSAAYQELRNTSTGATFLMVSTHLAVGSGMSVDKQREAEAEKMIADAKAHVGSSGVPIVYGGDYNSDNTPSHPLDGPAVAMRAAGNTDSFDSAQTITNGHYDSSNDYLRTAPVHNARIDQIYTTPGVGVTAWSLIINLRGGQFVGPMPSDHNPIMADLLIPYADNS